MISDPIEIQSESEVPALLAHRLPVRLLHQLIVQINTRRHIRCNQHIRTLMTTDKKTRCNNSFSVIMLHTSDILCPKISSQLQISECIMVNSRFLFETVIKTIILKLPLQFVLKVATFGHNASS